MANTEQEQADFLSHTQVLEIRSLRIMPRFLGSVTPWILGIQATAIAALIGWNFELQHALDKVDWVVEDAVAYAVDGLDCRLSDWTVYVDDDGYGEVRSSRVNCLSSRY